MITIRQVTFGASIVGLLVSTVILTLMIFHVSGVLNFHQVDLMYVFWPSSMMLTVGWRTTAMGITTTMLSVMMNCLLYAGLAILLRAAILSAVGIIRRVR